MHDNDWSLIGFTLITQVCVGIMLFHSLAALFSKDYFEFITNSKTGSAIALFLLASFSFALLLSFFHLGNPFHAYNAANNIGSSWLSREILGALLFWGSLLIVFVGLKLNVSLSIIRVAFVFSLLSGIFLLFSMIHIYLVPTIPSWNTWYTPFSFVSVAVVFFLLFFLVLYQNSMDFNMPRLIPSKTIIVLLICVLFLEGAAALFHFSELKILYIQFGDPLFSSNRYLVVLIIRVVLYLLVFFFGFLTMKTLGNSPAPNAVFVWILLFLTILQEVIGRMQFFAGNIRIGL